MSPFREETQLCESPTFVQIGSNVYDLDLVDITLSPPGSDFSPSQEELCRENFSFDFENLGTYNLII